MVVRVVAVVARDVLRPLQAARGVLELDSLCQGGRKDLDPLLNRVRGGPWGDFQRDGVVPSGRRQRVGVIASHLSVAGEPGALNAFRPLAEVVADVGDVLSNGPAS